MLPQLADYQQVHLEVFKDQLNTTIQLFGPTIGAATGAVTKGSGVLFTNAPGIPADTQDPQGSVNQPVPALPCSWRPWISASCWKEKEEKENLHVWSVLKGI